MEGASHIRASVPLCVGSASGEEETGKSPEGIADQNVPGDPQEGGFTDSDLDDEVQFQSSTPTSSSSRTTAANMDRTVPCRPAGPIVGPGSSCLEPVGVCVVLCCISLFQNMTATGNIQTASCTQSS